MQDVYVWSRKIHRIALFFVVVLGLLQMITGIMMKLNLGDIVSARVVHNANSIFFSVAFFVQMMTGLYMYIHPWVVRWQNNRKIKYS